MQVIDKHTIKIIVPVGKKHRFEIIRDRRNMLHCKLGSVCVDCGAKTKPGRKGMLHMHHIFYPLGYEKNWSANWKHVSDDVFYSSYYPEIMEACVLLCRNCHSIRHGYKKVS